MTSLPATKLFLKGGPASRNIAPGQQAAEKRIGAPHRLTLFFSILLVCLEQPTC